MALIVEVPGRAKLALDFLLLDVNGTLSDRGALIEGVAERLDALRERLEPRLLSADTFDTLASLTERLDLPAQGVATGEEKARIVHELGAERCVAIGNGANDARMLAEAALGIAVIGPEGAAAAALAASDLVCRSIADALDLLLEPRALAAGLRA